MEHSESVISNNVLFQGRNYDRITGLYYFRARYFHPKLGRFLQTDPMGYQDSMNQYQSFNQNPVNFVDPLGMETLKIEELLFLYIQGYRNPNDLNFNDWSEQYVAEKKYSKYTHNNQIEYIYDPRTYDSRGDVLQKGKESYIHHDPTYSLIPITKHSKNASADELKAEYKAIHKFKYPFDPKETLENPIIDPEIKKAAGKTVFKHHIEDKTNALYVFETYRSFERSNQLVADGQFAAPGGRSWHNYGLAVDIVFQSKKGRPTWSEQKDWDRLGRVGTSAGFYWGGNFTNSQGNPTPDRPHFEIKGTYKNTREALDLYNSVGGGRKGIRTVQKIKELYSYLVRWWTRGI
ncbi:RHS repeat-associated core domain-containing protein [Acidobacteriota bacterium]